MIQVLEYLVPVMVNDEFYDDGPSNARIEINSELLKRIRKLSKTVKELEAYCMEDWDVTPEFLGTNNDDGGYKDWDRTIETLRLKVDNDSFRWVGYIKDTNILCETEGIDIKEMDENLKVLRAKETDLPRLAVSEFKYPSSKELVEKRLKGEV
jgi:hypothetical protein